MPTRRAVIMNRVDNVATAVEEIQAGDEITAVLGGETVSLSAAEMIPYGFKVSLAEIGPGETVKKYGEAIGRATMPIAKGTMVHIHNLEGIRGRGDLVEGGRR
ncbi:MAG TPA: UxaA family hydrolase [Chloroflexota bacterium]